LKLRGESNEKSIAHGKFNLPVTFVNALATPLLLLLACLLGWDPKSLTLAAGLVTTALGAAPVPSCQRSFDWAKPPAQFLSAAPSSNPRARFFVPVTTQPRTVTSVLVPVPPSFASASKHAKSPIPDAAASQLFGGTYAPPRS
jgi:hypothetical protein